MLVDLRKEPSSGQLALTRIKYREEVSKFPMKRALEKKVHWRYYASLADLVQFSREKKELFKASSLERGDLDLVYIPTNIAG